MPWWKKRPASIVKMLGPGVCPYCGFQMSKDKTASNGATYDHILPLAANGSNHPTNLKVVCKLCNQSRAVAGHCVGALACVRAVLGRKRPTVGDVARVWVYWRGPSRPPGRRSGAERGSGGRSSGPDRPA